MLTTQVKRRDFVLVYDVTNGNPNGNPDDGGAPRTDLDDYAEVTAECIKRKIRTSVSLVMDRDDGSSEEGFEMYVRRGSVLNRAIRDTYEKAGIEIVSPKTAKKGGKSSGKSRAKAESDDADGEDSPKLEEKDMRVSADEARKGNIHLCKRFFDVRWFGAVVVGVGSGRITGPLQVNMGKSVLPVELRQIGNTRCATTNEKQAEEQQGRNQNMSRKTIIPHAVFVQTGHLNPFHAKNTGFAESDWETFLAAAKSMFENDRASGRGLMTLQQLIVFEHEDPLGNARAADLFKLVHIRPTGDETPSSIDGYAVTIDKDRLPAGITLHLLYPELEAKKSSTHAQKNGQTQKKPGAAAGTA
ncbi:MAG TPA: type I-C CRISPR-associated protein Cas7/Csd2 [Thermoanaerobaculia bacterium]|nr:type I-C CRISPR-associated protein Cas7/Csd2 [Thermoanaerobaculia bacterium]